MLLSSAKFANEFQVDYLAEDKIKSVVAAVRRTADLPERIVPMLKHVKVTIQQDAQVEPETQQIEQIQRTAPTVEDSIKLTASTVEDAIKLILDHWGKIFNAYKEGEGFNSLNDPFLDFETELEEIVWQGIQVKAYQTQIGCFFDIFPYGELFDEIEEKEELFIEKGLEGVRPEELPRSFMDKIFQNGQTKIRYLFVSENYKTPQLLAEGSL